MNVDRMIAEQRAALLATRTGQHIAATPTPGSRTETRTEWERRTATPKVRRHTRTAGYLKDDL